MKPAVFLDRDGVINASIVRNQKPYPPATLEEYRILPGVAQGVQLLKQAGYLVVVVTNQPDVGNRIQRQEVVEAMHALIRRELPLDAIEVCYHTRQDGCDCRKPKPGMILGAARRLTIDLARSYLVGDRWTDIQAGIAAGCRTFMVGDGYSEPKVAEPDWQVPTLLEAARTILSQKT